MDDKGCYTLSVLFKVFQSKSFNSDSPWPVTEEINCKLCSKEMDPRMTHVLVSHRAKTAMHDAVKHTIYKCFNEWNGKDSDILIKEEMILIELVF